MELLDNGQKLTLSFIKANKLVEIIATVDSIYGDRMTVDLPTYFMRYIKYLSVGSLLTVKVFSKAGTLNFNSMVIKSPLEDEFTIELDRNSIVLEPAENIEPINAIETLIIKKEDGEEIKCHTIEISMNELKFNSSTELQINSEIECSLLVPDSIGSITFRALVNERNLMYDSEYTAIYMTITEESKQNLLYYMYMYSNDDADGKTNEKI